MNIAAGGADGEPLLERDDAMAVVRGALARAHSGEGQVVLLSGEAGIGKTALTRALCASAGGGIRVLEGACDALFLPRPLGPFADVAAEVGGRLAELVDRGAPPYQVLTPLLAMLEERPTILVLEDLHWADEATLDVFRLLARRVRTLPVLVLATYRDEALTPTNPLAIVQGDVARLRTTTRLQLRALSPAAVATLAEPHGLDAVALFSSTGGNPFFVTEVLAAPGDRIPPTARDAVLTRVAMLSPAGRALLEAVAICPPSVDLALIHRLSEDASALTECISSGMLVETGREFAFRHELARLAVETSIPPNRRRRLHEGALGALAEPARGQPDLARLAHHAEAADDAAAVLRYAIAAGEHAAVLGAHREASEQYARALRFADGLSRAELAKLYSLRSHECYVSDQPDAAIDALHHVRRCRAEIGDPMGEGHALALLSSVSWCPGHLDDAIRFGHEAVQILETLPAGPELCDAYLTLAFIHQRGLDATQSAIWLDRAATLAGHLDDDVRSADVQISAARQALITTSADGFDAIDRARDRAERLGLFEHSVWAYQASAEAAVTAHLWPRVDTSVEAGLTICRDTGDDLDANYLHAAAAQADLARGRWNDAIERAELILTTPTVSTYPRTIAHVVIGLVRARRGDPDAQASLDRAHSLAEQAGEFPRLALSATARAEHAWLRGQPEEVAGITDPVLRCARRPGDEAMISQVHVWRRRAGIIEPVPGGAREPHVHELSGDPARAAAAWRDLGCPYEAAVALANTPDPDALLHAHEALIDIGARPAAAIVARRLREIGAGGVRRGPRPSTSTNPALLTAREVEVLRLLSTGLQNKQIASRLYLSPKTVDHHVSAVLRKLGARTRGEAIAAAARLGLDAAERRKSLRRPNWVAPSPQHGQSLRCAHGEPALTVDLVIYRRTGGGMDTYIILRRSGWRDAADLTEAAARSTAEGERLPDEVSWIRSYVLAEPDGRVGTVCVYQAAGPEAIRRHAESAVLPVDEIVKVLDTVVVAPDPSITEAGSRP